MAQWHLEREWWSLTIDLVILFISFSPCSTVYGSSREMRLDLVLKYQEMFQFDKYQFYMNSILRITMAVKHVISWAKCFLNNHCDSLHLSSRFSIIGKRGKGRGLGMSVTLFGSQISQFKFCSLIEIKCLEFVEMQNFALNTLVPTSFRDHWP